MRKKLFIPGPTEVKDEILQAQAKPMIGHRMKEFSELYKRVVEKSKELLGVKRNAYIVTSSGTALMEAAIRNTVKNKVLACVNGAFSDRWAKIAKACGKEVDRIEVEWGKAIKPEMVEEKLKNNKYDAITIAHNETSTAVRNPIGDISEVVHKYDDSFILVDTVSSLMGDKIEIEKWNLDIALSSSQKAFALPPGLSWIAISDRAMERSKEIPDRGYYFDFQLWKKYYDERNQTPSTPAISLIYALDVQLEKMEKEGMENRYRRHIEMAEYVRQWSKKHFELFAEPGYESVTVTAVKNIKEVSIADLNKTLGERGFAISNGYGKLKEKTFRIAHMGDLTLDEIKELIKNINEILKLEG